MSKESPIYRVQFISNGERYELYVKELTTSSIFGFVEIGDFVWDKHTELVLDPSHEKLKDEFADVDRTYLPMHHVLRIDQVAKQGSAKITQLSDKVTALNTPIYTPKK
ncbi:DUF1820 family protein [Agaribacter marinus]|uniref:DUF1820 domain-containing protein n=1 Tax=Agaribacter marinus TaxID=1431249 RepID=A0AA37STY0_9ALTE|nr:DUF1820 family protein [Agaribacter marinus]GLR69102.1 hypothetical protein GCM10007852_00100 [Agaribacter marinus]